MDGEQEEEEKGGKPRLTLVGDFFSILSLNFSLFWADIYNTRSNTSDWVEIVIRRHKIIIIFGAVRFNTIYI